MVAFHHARCRRGVGAITTRKPVRAQQPKIAGARSRVRGQGFGRIAVGRGISARCKFIRRETKRCEVNLRRLDTGQRIAQQCLILGDCFCDANISKLQHEHRKRSHDALLARERRG